MASVKRVVRTPAAKQDLLDIWGYYARVGSPDVADATLRELDLAIREIPINTLLSRDRSELMAGLRFVLVRPHIVFFLVSNEEIRIMRILHGRRDFPAILSLEEH